MMQSFNTQLQVALRALREVVGPALSQSEKHAVEQFQLSLATLEFVRIRLPYARRYHRLELENYLSLAAEILDLVRGDQHALGDRLVANITAGWMELTRPEAELEDYVAVTRTLRETIASAVRAAISKPYEQALDLLVIRRQEHFLMHQRAWCVALGADFSPNDLPQLEELLAASNPQNKVG